MKRNAYTPDEKGKIVLETLRGERTVDDAAKKRKEDKAHEEELQTLYAKIGQLTTQNSKTARRDPSAKQRFQGQRRYGCGIRHHFPAKERRADCRSARVGRRQRKQRRLSDQPLFPAAPGYGFGHSHARCSCVLSGSLRLYAIRSEGFR